MTTDKSERITELETRLKEYREAYYNGNPLVEDDVYDALEDELRDLAPQHPILRSVGAFPDGKTKWVKVPHTMPMTSLNKVNDANEFHAWSDELVKSIESQGKRLQRYVDPFFWSEKLDGISLALNYQDGSLKSATTRGDGLVGEDIMANAVLMRGVIRELPGDLTGSIRGEVVLTHDMWQDHFPDYANPRNAASGIAKRESREKAKACQYLTFMAYDVASRDMDFETEMEKFIWLKSLGFSTPNYSAGGGLSPGDIESVYEEYEEQVRDELNYDIDGLVIRLFRTKDYQNAGERGGNPYGSIALKFANQGAVTTLDRVRWQVGNTGRLTPVAEFEPVRLAGAEVSKASCYNWKYLTEMGVASGDKILVVRANDVIPRVEKVVEKYQEVALTKPSECPDCGSEVEEDGEYLVCTGGIQCPSQVAGNIKRWIESLGILDWGDFIVEKLVSEGLVSSIGDLYELEPSDIAPLKNANDAVVGEKTAKKILTELREKSESTTFDAVLGGLNIPHCRRSTARKIMKAGYDDFSDLWELEVSQLEKVEGLGHIKSASIHDGLQVAAPLVTRLIEEGHVGIEKATGPLEGKTFCLTGSMSKPRKHIERDIEAAGGTMKGVSKSLDYLVLSNPDSTSSKAKKARNYDIPLLSEEELYDMME